MRTSCRSSFTSPRRNGSFAIRSCWPPRLVKPHQHFFEVYQPSRHQSRMKPPNLRGMRASSSSRPCARLAHRLRRRKFATTSRTSRTIPGIDGIYNFKKVPQRGLDVTGAVVTRWDAKVQTWEPVSKPHWLAADVGAESSGETHALPDNGNTHHGLVAAGSSHSGGRFQRRGPRPSISSTRRQSSNRPLVIYTGAGPGGAKALADAFEKRFPGIAVTAHGGFSNVLDIEIDQQLKDNKVTADFVQFQTIQDYHRWDKRGAAHAFQARGFDQVFAAMKDKNGAWVAVNAIPPLLWL